MIPGLFLLAWGAIAVGLGVLIGRAIHLADCCPHDEAGEPVYRPTRLETHL